MHNILQLLKINKKVYIRWCTEIRIKLPTTAQWPQFTLHEDRITVMELVEQSEVIGSSTTSHSVVCTCLCQYVAMDSEDEEKTETSSSITLLLLTCPLDTGESLVIIWSWNWPQCLNFWLSARRQRTHYSRKREKKKHKISNTSCRLHSENTYVIRTIYNMNWRNQ